MGVSKESISKFLIGSRFHVKLRILSPYSTSVATSPMALRWMCDQPRMGCARRTTPIYIYVAQTSNNRVIAACYLYSCLLPQREALRTCRSGFPIATIESCLAKFRVLNYFASEQNGIACMQFVQIAAHFRQVLRSIDYKARFFNVLIVFCFFLQVTFGKLCCRHSLIRLA